MTKCKTDFGGCCCNVDGECTYWGSCHNQTFENKSISELTKEENVNIPFKITIL